MKKIIAILLCVLCLFSSVTIIASAEDGIIGKISSIIGLESDDDIGYGITYDSNKSASGVSGVMYEPKPTVTIRDKGTYTVTEDIPLAIDYEFVCWVDKETGKKYYAGDKYYVNGQKTLYAVWVEKSDNNIRIIRVILTSFEAFKRSIQSFLGVFKVESVDDPTTDLNEKYFFKVDDLIKSEYYVYTENHRTFEFKIKLNGDKPYESFSRTEDIYLGGDVIEIEEKVIVDRLDKDGNVMLDENKNPIKVEERVFKYDLVNAQKYSALYETKGATDVDEDGYQTIRVTITDGVPDVNSKAYVTFVLPSGILRYKGADSQLYANKEYQYRTLSPVVIK